MVNRESKTHADDGGRLMAQRPEHDFIMPDECEMDMRLYGRGVYSIDGDGNKSRISPLDLTMESKLVRTANRFNPPTGPISGRPILTKKQINAWVAANRKQQTTYEVQ